MTNAGVALGLEEATDQDPSRSLLDWFERRLDRIATVIVLVPLAVAAVVLVGVGGRYLSASDLALEELAVRDIGRHPVLVGLNSRGGWGHPGPLLYYLLVPFYWLTGGRSIGLDLGALAINGAAIAGMAWVARRHGGTPLLLCTLAGCALVMRTLGADFLHDSWVCYVTTLPFGLLIMLSWSLTRGEHRVLPVAAFVASFVAQTHIGFVALAPPLLLWGAGWLLLTGWRSGDVARRRELVRSSVVALGVLVVVWSPLLLDALLRSPSNTGKIWRWFGDEEEFGVGVHTLGDGWRVVMGQFQYPPEWLTTKLQPVYATFGESVLLYDHGTPWLLLPVALAVWVLWRRRGSRRSVEVEQPDAQDGSETQDASAVVPAPHLDVAPSAEPRPCAGGGGDPGQDDHALWLVATLGVALLVGIVAVARTIGPVVDYRLRWTWMTPMLVFVVVAWAAWLALRDRWSWSERRWLVPGLVALLVVVSGVNVVTAAATGTPHAGDSRIVASLTEQVSQEVDPDGGQVMVDAPLGDGLWWSRGLVLQLVKRGVDVRIPDDPTHQFGHHRHYEGGPVQAWLLILRDEAAEVTMTNPDVELVARWSSDEPTGDTGARDVAVFRDPSRA